MMEATGIGAKGLARAIGAKAAEKARDTEAKARARARASAKACMG